MNIQTNLRYLGLILILVLGVQSCDNTNGNPDLCEIDFDQSAMFQNLADNLIIPGYLELQTRVDDLDQKAKAFLLSPDMGHLNELRSAYLQAYYAWQTVAQYEFGPAETVFLRNSVNNFPLNIEEIRANILSGDYDFNLPDRFDKGLPAIDYLLFWEGNFAQDIVDRFTTDSLATNYQDYLNDVIKDIKERTDFTYSEWTDGGYRESFINNTGTAAGTSLSLIVNGFNENYELIKRDKIGIPAGVLTIGFTNPTKAEAFFMGTSGNLALQALRASEDLYLGRNPAREDGLGLDDYLLAAENEELDQKIQAQFVEAIQAVEKIVDPYSEFVDSNSIEANAAYAEISKQLVNIKTDLPTVLCVSITYIDNPSDSD